MAFVAEIDVAGIDSPQAAEKAVEKLTVIAIEASSIQGYGRTKKLRLIAAKMEAVRKMCHIYGYDKAKKELKRVFEILQEAKAEDDKLMTLLFGI